MKQLFEALYKSEINLSFKWFWDSGYEVSLGDDMNGVWATHNTHDLDEMEKWIEKSVKEKYPASKFAKEYNSNILRLTKPEYVMGVDFGRKDEDVHTYVLSRKVNGVTEVLLMRQSEDKEEFEKEAEKIAELFNAERYQE